MALFGRLLGMYGGLPLKVFSAYIDPAFLQLYANFASPALSLVSEALRKEGAHYRAAGTNSPCARAISAAAQPGRPTAA